MLPDSFFDGFDGLDELDDFDDLKAGAFGILDSFFRNRFFSPDSAEKLSSKSCSNNGNSCISTSSCSGGACSGFPENFAGAGNAADGNIIDASAFVCSYKPADAAESYAKNAGFAGYVDVSAANAAEENKEYIVPGYQLASYGDKEIVTVDLPGADADKIRLYHSDDDIELYAPLKRIPSFAGKEHAKGYYLRLKLKGKRLSKIEKKSFKNGVFEACFLRA